MIVEFEDWTFDGVPLRSLIDGEPVQESTDLSAGFPDEALLAARRLSGELPGDLPDAFPYSKIASTLWTHRVRWCSIGRSTY